MADVISQANEAFERKYELKRLGYDLDRIVERVVDICKAERDYSLNYNLIYAANPPREKYKKRTIAIVKGEYKPRRGEPMIWFESVKF